MNPVSGSCRQLAQVRAALGVLRARGVESVLELTTGPGHARTLAARAADAPADVVLVVGGDGTVSEAADGLVGRDLPMIIWPAGTENLVARSLGFRADGASILEAVLHGHVHPLDVGMINGRSFLVVVGVGFDAEVVHRLESLRRGHITHLTYAGPLWRTFWEHRFPPVRVTADGAAYWEGRGMVFIGNMARYALGLPVVRDARPDDGLLDLCIMPCRGHADLIGHSIRTLLAQHVEHPSVKYLRVREVRVESARRVPVEIDGDGFGHLPIAVTIRPGALRVKIPPREDARYNAASS